MNPKTEVPEMARPLPLKAWEVRAILEGRKTQTRRIVADKRLTPKLTLIELFDFLGGGGKCDSSDDDGLRISFVRDSDRQDDNGRRYKYTGLLVQSEAVPEDGAEEIMCPYGVAGDRLWVRETFLQRRDCDTLYRATTPMDDTAWQWKSSGCMPRKLSRITLEITTVRVERLQEISEEDAWAEGLQKCPSDFSGVLASETDPSRGADGLAFAAGNAGSAQYVFRSLWDSIHNPRGYCAEDAQQGWDANPWVWVLEIKRDAP